MIKLNGSVTDSVDFYMGNDPFALISAYGSPLYVYNENILRERCREMAGLTPYEHFRVHFSVKANTNITLMSIARDEGLYADAVSPGEIYLLLEAGFKPHEIFYIPNNVSDDELKYAAERNILTSADSLSQLERIGRISPGADVAVRFNPGVGVGHHEKVVTAGEKVKFGVLPEYIPQVKNILNRYGLKLIGVNQHLGSLFMDYNDYLKGVSNLLDIAAEFKSSLQFIDLGGGFGTPYRKQAGEKRLDLKALGRELNKVIDAFAASYGRKITFKIEPGRYISAECGVLLGEVHSVKHSGADKYAGTDLGFNVLIRPAMYESHHDIEVYRKSGDATGKTETVSIVGNICESSDTLAGNRLLPEILEGDLICVLDAGAYGYAMSSNYNSRLRPAEVLIRSDGNVELIRRRDTYEDLVRNF